MWSLLENVLCLIENNVYSAVVRLSISTCLLGPIVVKDLYFLIEFLSSCKIIESGVLKSPTMIVLLSISLFLQYLLCFLRTLMFGKYIFIIVIFSCWFDTFFPFAIVFDLVSSPLLWLSFAFIFHLFTWLCVSLDFKWFS